MSLSTGVPIQSHFHVRHVYEHLHNNNKNDDSSGSNSNDSSTNDSSLGSMNYNITTTNQYMVRAFSSNKESV